jgi:DNA-binding MarR family transcriptional regulator
MTDEKMRNKKVPLGNNTRKHILINPLKIVACISQQVKCAMQFLEGEEKMQTVQDFQHVTNGNIKRQLSSFELITNWIDTGYTLNLSSNAIQLMTVLLRFYNPDKKFVFPHQGTLAERTKTSLATVKRGLNELIKAQLVIKTRKQSGNVYGFTSKLFELLDSSNCTIPTAQNEPCMKGTNKGTNKEQTTCKPIVSEPKKAEVVSFSSFSLKKIPDSILAKKTDRNGRQIRNHAAYWNSLTDAQKREYLKQEEENTAKTRKKEELKRQAQIEKQRQKEEKKKLQEQLSRPLHEQWSRAQAIKHVWQTRNLHKGILKEGLTKSLVKLYNLDVTSICAMTEAEFEKFS